MSMDFDSRDRVGDLVRLAGPRAQADADRTARVRRAAELAWQQAVRARRRTRLLWIGAPLGLAAAAAVFFALARQSAPAPALRITATAADFTTVPIAGGGEIRLDRRTSIRWVADRDIELQHGAVFVVTNGGGSPVAVRTPAGIVRDIGTRFEVRVETTGTRIRVRDGEIELQTGSTRHRSTAGTEVFASPDGTLQDRVIATDSSDWLWTMEAAPPFTVDGATLDAFLQWVEHESGRKVSMNENVRRTLASTRLHGSIAGLSIDEALDVVLPTCGLQWRTVDHRIEIRRADQQ
jgi:ferric-dicitrate binding protein FerR (iron transport regulator)